MIPVAYDTHAVSRRVPADDLNRLTWFEFVLFEKTKKVGILIQYARHDYSGVDGASQ